MKYVCASFALVGTVLFAQVPENTEAPVVLDLINSDAGNRMVELGTLTYQVPVEQMGAYSYYVFVFLGSFRSMDDDVAPDENGVIRKQVSVPMNIYSDMGEGPLPHFLFAYNRYDGRRFYTMALVDVPLRQVIGNLALSVMHANRGRGQNRPRVDYLDDRAREATVSLNGERLRPSDIYALIRAQTGCGIVELPDGTLSVDCGY